MTEEPIPEWRKQMNSALVVQSDMNEDLQIETVDLVTSAIEKSQGNLELCVKSLKEDMDKKSGPGWNVVVGEDFSHYVTYTKNMIFLYFGGNMGVLMWK